MSTGVLSGVKVSGTDSIAASNKPASLLKADKIINYLRSRAVYSYLSLLPARIQPKTLLLIKLDAIGDYILFRNFLGLVRNSAEYKDHKITLLGSSGWESLSKFLDTKQIDDFIPFNRQKFDKSVSYRYRLFREVRSRGFETVMVPSYSRDYMKEDLITGISGAENKIGNLGNPDEEGYIKRAMFGNKIYTRLITPSAENLFEYKRNHEFFNGLFGKELPLPELELGNVPPLPASLEGKKHITLFVGGNNAARRWFPSNYKKLILDLRSLDGSLLFCVAGSGVDTREFDNIPNTIDMRESTSLPELVSIIAHSDFLISNESGAIHIAAAAGTPFICISNANHLGRFHPYPEEIFPKGFYVYPFEWDNSGTPDKSLVEKYRLISEVDVNEISVERVMAIAVNKLKEFNVI